MSIYIDQTTNRLYVQFRHDGKIYKKRFPDGTTKAEALRFETKWKHDLFFSEHLPDEKQVIFQRFAEDVFLPHVKANHSPGSVEKAIVILKAAAPFLYDKDLRAIRPDDLERFKTLRMNTPTMHGRKRKNATIHREMSIISRLFTLAMRNDLCDKNPCRNLDMPKFDNIQDTILRIEDEERFLCGFRYRLQREICLTVLYTGLRQNDVLGLRKGQVDLIDNEIRLVQGKTQRRVIIPILPKIQDVFISRLDNDSDLFFPSYKTGGQMKSLKSSVIAACERARIPRMTIRDLRRTFGTRLHENGYDDKTIADLLGHNGLGSIRRYKRGTEIKRKAILSLENLANDTKMHTRHENDLYDESLEPNKTLGEMGSASLLSAALRTQIVH